MARPRSESDVPAARRAATGSERVREDHACRPAEPAGARALEGDLRIGPRGPWRIVRGDDRDRRRARVSFRMNVCPREKEIMEVLSHLPPSRVTPVRVNALGRRKASKNHGVDDAVTGE